MIWEGSKREWNVWLEYIALKNDTWEKLSVFSRDIMSVCKLLMVYGHLNPISHVARYFLLKASNTSRGLFDCLQIHFEGITGNVEFDPNGFRTNLQMDILELAKNVIIIEIPTYIFHFSTAFTALLS